MEHDPMALDKKQDAVGESRPRRERQGAGA
jgi:hypothetical protein